MTLLAAAGAGLGLVACGSREDPCRHEVEACEQTHATLLKNYEQLRSENQKLAEELRRARATLAFESSSEGFGKTTWGMSRYQVRRVYPKAQVQDARTVIFDRKIESHPVRTYFHFANDRLTDVRIVPEGEIYGIDGYHVIFQDLLKLLVRKYGPPREGGRRSSSGAARLEKVWETEKTLIELVLIEGGLKPVLQLDYRSKELGYLSELDQTQQTMDDL